MNQIDEVAHLIQLSIAPVFLLTGVGTLLNVLSGRLARIIDCARVLEQRLDTPHPLHADATGNELHVLERRGTGVIETLSAESEARRRSCRLCHAPCTRKGYTLRAVVGVGH
jgi:hypothetical protein